MISFIYNFTIVFNSLLLYIVCSLYNIFMIISYFNYLNVYSPLKLILSLNFINDFANIASGKKYPLKLIIPAY